VPARFAWLRLSIPLLSIEAGARALQEMGRWLLLGLLILAPWAFGSTREWTISLLIYGMDVVAALSILAIMGNAIALRRFSLGGIPWVQAVLALALLGYGWSAAWNAESYFDPYLLRFIPETKWLHFWPSTIDSQISNATMERLSALLLMTLVSANAGRSQTWRRRVLVTMAGTGISIAIFGIAQKLARAPLLFWEPERFGETVFAMYRYHANAGAYLNLIWPICGALAMGAFEKRYTPLQRAVWVPAIFVILAGLVLNVSKGAQMVAVVMMMASGLLVFLLTKAKGRFWGRGGLASLLAFGAIMATVITIGWKPVVERWAEFFHGDPANEGRIWMARACLDMIRDRPCYGFGPGAFVLVFPFYSKPYGRSLEGFWHYAHCDYLQTLVEWGIIGSLLWALLISGGIGLQLKRILAERGHRGRSRRGEETAFDLEQRGAFDESGLKSGREQISSALDAAVLLSLGGVLLHAAFDFPLQIASIQLYFAVLLGFTWRQKPKRNSEKEN